jgi:ribosomal protein L37AE/L43A
MSAGGRAQPFYCPYCGESDLRPEEAAGAWRCEICDRLFDLAYSGLAGATRGQPSRA